MCLNKDFLKLLDISNYLAPRFSYSPFLKAYECEQTKGFFPNQWLDDLDKLEETSLSPYDAFSSTLKNQNITHEEYQYCQQVGKTMKCSSLNISCSGTIIWMYSTFLRSSRKNESVLASKKDWYVQRWYFCSWPHLKVFIERSATWAFVRLRGSGYSRTRWFERNV